MEGPQGVAFVDGRREVAIIYGVYCYGVDFFILKTTSFRVSVRRFSPLVYCTGFFICHILVSPCSLSVKVWRLYHTKKTHLEPLF